MVSGWSGIPLIILCGTLAAYNGMNLGRCWVMLLEFNPELRAGEERRPYPAIGQKAFGNWMRYLHFYHPRMLVGNVFYSRVCPSICLSVCLSVQAITFTPLHIELHFWHGGIS